MNKKKVVPGQKLSALLDLITTELSDSDKAQERNQRTLVLKALKKYTRSRFHLGEALACYRQACKLDRIWLRAAEAIAKHMSISPRTLFRILTDYERVSGVPQSVFSAMVAEGFDPAKCKNAPLLDEITDAITDDSSPEQAQEVVRRTAASLKQRKGKDLISEDDRIVRGLRSDIRKRLANVPDPDRKWELLQEAICQESFEVWGDTKEWRAVFTPPSEAETPDGPHGQTQAVAA